MVAACERKNDARYDISAYISKGDSLQREPMVGGFPAHPSRSICATAECPPARLTVGTSIDWKCEAFELLEAAVGVKSLDWRALYNAMQRAIPSYVVVKESSDTERRFADLAQQWRDETAILSSVEMGAMHPAYQRIIGMGSDVLPMILTELAREPQHWFWALCAITGENPVEPEDAGDLNRMTQAWLDLGRKRGWI